jgi:deoxyribonuclease V
MEPIFNHSFTLTESEALNIQSKLSSKVIKENCFNDNDINYIAGIDVAYNDKYDFHIASVVILDSKSLELLSYVTIKDNVNFPYIPGLFSFREIPPVIKALKQLKVKPDLVVCDGHGIAHPRRFGLASHLGVLFDIPTIGCAKNRLIGEIKEIKKERGKFSPLIDNNEIIGNVLTTQNNVKPIFVSIGHKISLETACKWILKLSPKYRIPEPVRQSDHLVRIGMKNYSFSP